MPKTYLKIVEFEDGRPDSIGLFEGDIEEDKKHLKKHHKGITRYREWKEA